MDGKSIATTIITVVVIGLLAGLLVPSVMDGMVNLQDNADTYENITTRTIEHENVSVEFNGTVSTDVPYVTENHTDGDNEVEETIGFYNYSGSNNINITQNINGDYTTVLNETINYGDVVYYNYTNSADNGSANITVTINDLSYSPADEEWTVNFDITQDINTVQNYPENIIDILPIIPILFITGILLVVIGLAIKVVV